MSSLTGTGEFVFSTSPTIDSPTLVSPNISNPSITGSLGNISTGTITASAGITASGLITASAGITASGGTVSILPYLYNPYKFNVSLPSAQTVSATTWTLVELSSINFDTSSSFNTSTYMFTTPISGYYMLIGSALPQASTSAITQVGININSFSSEPTYVFGASPSSSSVVIEVSTFVHLNAGDTIQLYAYAANTTIYSQNTYLAGFLVSAT